MLRWAYTAGFVRGFVRSYSNMLKLDTEALLAQLMRTVTRRFSPPHVIALVTANQGRTSFPDCVEAALKHAWQVELYAWRQSTNKVYSAMAEQYMEHFTLHHLDKM